MKKGQELRRNEPLKTKLFWINLRTTEEERDQLRKDAHRHEMNVSEYIRWLVEREREEIKK